jgi:hypothetical protein
VEEDDKKLAMTIHLEERKAQEIRKSTGWAPLCSLCRKNIFEDLQMIECNHFFHRKCIAKYAQTKV